MLIVLVTRDSSYQRRDALVEPVVLPLALLLADSRRSGIRKGRTPPPPHSVAEPGFGFVHSVSSELG